MARTVSIGHQDFEQLITSFANVKERDYPSTVLRICQLVTDLYRRNRFLLDSEVLSEEEG